MRRERYEGDDPFPNLIACMLQHFEHCEEVEIVIPTTDPVMYPERRGIRVWDLLHAAASQASVEIVCVSGAAYLGFYDIARGLTRTASSTYANIMVLELNVGYETGDDVAGKYSWPVLRKNLLALEEQIVNEDPHEGMSKAMALMSKHFVLFQLLTTHSGDVASTATYGVFKDFYSVFDEVRQSSDAQPCWLLPGRFLALPNSTRCCSLELVYRSSQRWEHTL